MSGWTREPSGWSRGPSGWQGAVGLDQRAVWPEQGADQQYISPVRTTRVK
jgi:hypothetical protein